MFCNIANQGSLDKQLVSKKSFLYSIGQEFDHYSAKLRANIGGKITTEENHISFDRS